MPPATVHEKDIPIPDGLVATASREPEATLRTEVLLALEVRRPDLRPMLRWMIDRGASVAAVVTRGGDAEGSCSSPKSSARIPCRSKRRGRSKGSRTPSQARSPHAPRSRAAWNANA